MANYYRVTAGPVKVTLGNGDTHTFATNDQVDPTGEFYAPLAAIPNMLVDSGTPVPPPSFTPPPPTVKMVDVTSSATAPASPSTDDLWFDTNTGQKILKRWNGTAWESSGNAAYVGTVGLASGDATGATDTTAINALLTAARTAGGGQVKGLPGQNYIVNAPLVVGSGTTLDMTGCTVTLAGTGANLLNNYALTAARTVMDAVTTGASTTVTSATAAFVSGDVGATVWVWGGGAQGDIHRTAIASVTNGTTAVLTAAPTTSLAAATMSVGPRDTRITVIGGTWARGGIGGAGNTVHNLRFRRADQITVKGVTVTSTAAKYAINFGDCSEFTVDGATFDVYADGVHVNGPCERGVIRDLRGYTRDDTCSITPNDWSPYNDVYGDVSDIYIEDVRPYKSDNTCVKVLGGSATPLTTARRIRARNVGGLATNVDQSHGGLVWIGDDPGQSTTTGGRIDDVTIENVAGRCKATEELVLINGTNVGRVKVSGLAADPPATAAALSVVGLAWVNGNAVIDSLTIEGFTMHPQLTVSSGHLSIQSGSTVKSLRVRDVQMIGGTSNHLVQNAGTVGRAEVSDVHGVGSCASTWLWINASTGSTTDLLMDRIQIGAGTGWKSPVRADSGGTLTRFRISNSNLDSSQFCLGEFSGTHTIHVSNLKGNANPLWCSNASSNVTMYVESTDFVGGTISTTAGYQLNSKSFGFVLDLSFLTNKSTGDRATNNSNANTGTLGVGPAVYTGTAWKSLVSGNTF